MSVYKFFKHVMGANANKFSEDWVSKVRLYEDNYFYNSINKQAKNAAVPIKRGNSSRSSGSLE